MIMDLISREDLMRRLLQEKHRRIAIAKNPHFSVDCGRLDSVDCGEARHVTIPLISYTATRDDMVHANYETAKLLDEVLDLLKTVNESERDMRKRILSELTQYLQEPKNGKGS